MAVVERTIIFNISRAGDFVVSFMVDPLVSFLVRVIRTTADQCSGFPPDFGRRTNFHFRDSARSAWVGAGGLAL
jgi:hypothetical protein